MAQHSRVTLKVINRKVYEGSCRTSQMSGILKKIPKMKVMKENDTETISESSKWKFVSGRTDNSCEFYRKVDEQYIKDFNRGPRCNKLRSETISKMFFR
jgi:hypothetical protein